jgi:translocation and assembly module TamB
VKGVSPWRSEDVDVGLDIRNDTTSGFTNVSARVTDKKGVVVAFDVKSDLPYAELLADPGTAKAKLVRVPVSAKVVVPKRSLDDMPMVLGVKNMSGYVEAQVDVGGTPLEPNVQVVAHAREFRNGTVALDKAADADVGLTYDGKVADLAVKVATEKREVLSVASHVDAKVKDFLEPAPGTTPDWGATTKIALASFPLETVGPLASRQVKGRISGEAAIDGLNRDARMYAHLGFEKLTIGRAQYDTAKIDVDAGDGKLVAKARLDQKDGFADLSAVTGIQWGKRIAPKIRDDQPIEARLQAKAFRAAAIQPFVEGPVNQLDGRIDADAKALLSPSQKDAKLEGTIAIRDGLVQLSAVGEEFRDLRANVTLHPDGRIEVRDVFARSIQGEVNAKADVKLKGMGLETADASLSIPKKHPLDLAMDGQPVGEVWGDINVNAKTRDDGKKLALVVDIPRFDVGLPQAMKTGVQELGENEKIRVGVYRDPHTLVKLPLDKEDFEHNEVEAKKLAAQADEKRTDIDIRLGRISIKRGNTGEAVLSGNPKITIDGGETKIVGQIKVDSGWADVQGKKFEIERGTVTFNGETPPNPVVVATATWKAEDDTQVYADFVGPVKTGKVNLRSEPPRPKSELLSLVLFGTSDGANPTPPPAGKQPNGTQKAAMGIGGGFAAQGLTEALDDLAGIQATARIDTTSSRNPRPEVEFQVSPKVSVAFSHVIGQPPVTEPPDKNMARLEWRFRNNWAFESTTGDRGRQLFDLIWSKRY